MQDVQDERDHSLVSRWVVHGASGVHQHNSGSVRQVEVAESERAAASTTPPGGG